jgi:transposase-like protein
MEVVRLYLEERLSYLAVAEKMGVSSNSQINNWVRKQLGKNVG